VTDLLHAVPLGDLIDHDTRTSDSGCPCGPETRPVKRDDGSYGWLLVHHALDNREATEERDG
jgi:hypothetical protein